MPITIFAAVTDHQQASEYQKRATRFKSESEAAKKRATLVGWLRLGAFVAAIVGPWVSYSSSGWLALGLGVGCFVAFLVLVRLNLKLRKHLAYLQALVTINQEEQGVLSGQFSQFSTGDHFLDQEHSYAHDLDLFGSGSLFQYLDRSATLQGQERLAHRLQFPWKSAKRIREQQAAIQELAGELEFRQDFLAIGRLAKEGPKDHEQLIQWCRETKSVASGAVYAVLLYLVPLAALAVTLAVAFDLLPAVALFYFILVPLGITGIHVKAINKQYLKTYTIMELLRKYARLLTLVEEKEFQSTGLNDLKSPLNEPGASAGQAIRQLSEHLASLDNRNNVIGALVLNGLFLWDIRYTRKIQDWQQKNGPKLVVWLEVLQEMDALTCLGNFAYNRPDAIVPNVVDEASQLQTEGMGHPLLISKKRIDNDFSLAYDGRFVILTGANMAGKSTFLRTVGVNLVLAMLGAPVVASKFVFSPVQLFSSMRTTDSLQDSASYFYAELRRLQQMVSLVNQDEPVFIILDEILKGTNSRDKEQGSKALVKRLVELGAGGIVATHDLALCELANTLPNRVFNHCFEVDITDEGLKFDYRLRSGICQNMNASYLMKDMGLI